MALEAVTNAMGVQATSYVAPPKAATAPVESVDYTPENVDPAAKIDETTKVVENADSKGESNYNGEKKQDDSQQVASKDQIRKAIEQFNKNRGNSEAIYGIHEDTNRVTIKIVDKDTKEVIKELPPEKTLDMIAKVWEMAGILVDEKR
ncbi:MAG: flagellar protein FlaG [Lachnospiraceae bacterium]|nr:flagellar protein FlaG [Lachnospiraceae bacterium]